MADKLEDTDEYRTAHSTFVAATAVADRSGNETDKLRAELEWERTRTRLEKTFEESNRNAERLKAVHEEIKEKYPAVPAALVNHITDPEALLQMAQEIQSKIGSGDWGAPAGAPGGATSRSSKLKEINDLKDRVNAGDPQARERFLSGIIRDQVMPFIEENRRGGAASRTS